MNEVEVEAVENVVKKSTSNIVELQNGETIDFRGNTVLASYDVPSKIVTFKVVTGEVLTLNVNNVPEAVKEEAAIYGLREKIKATLAPIKVVISEDEAKEGKLNKAGKIALEIKNLLEGNFVTRAQETGQVGLDSFMKAFATINAIGAIKIDNNGNVVPVPTQARLLPELKPTWANVTDPTVMQEVLSYWDSLDKDTKSAQKRNTSIKFQAELFDSGAVDPTII